MNYKYTTNLKTKQHLIAGIQKTDHNIEFFGIRKTKTVHFMQNGRTYPFNRLSGRNARAVVEAYEKDPKAKNILQNLKDKQGHPINIPYTRQIELYIYYCYGSLNGQPDIVDGQLKQTENFRDRIDCISLGFGNKKLHINGRELKPREITMIDLFARDEKDETVAKELGVALSTFNQHKKELFNKAGVKTKPALMIASMRDQLIE